MVRKIALALTLCGSHAACSTTTAGPDGMVSTQVFVETALKEYGVFGGGRPEQANPNPGM